MLIAGTGCAALDDSIRTAHSPLPIETVDATGGEIASTRAFETASKLYVAGTMRKGIGHHLHASAHVKVQLLDGAGTILAEEQDGIDPVHPRRAQARGHRYSYVASFPIETARQAAKIRVTYHPLRSRESTR